MHNVLLCDDDREFCQLLVEYLDSQGYAAQAVHDGEAALAALQDKSFDVLILDVMMPRMDGFETLKAIRERDSQAMLPVLMLTARGEDIDRIVGLEMGADDYLAKPANPRELVARIKAVLRRSSTQPTNMAAITIAELTLDTGQREVHCDGVPIDLTSTEFDILSQLMQNAGKVISKDALMEQALGRQRSGYDRSLDMHISKLRRKLGNEHGEKIKTVRNRGYQFARVAEPGT